VEECKNVFTHPTGGYGVMVYEKFLENKFLGSTLFKLKKFKILVGPLIKIKK